MNAAMYLAAVVTIAAFVGLLLVPALFSDKGRRSLVLALRSLSTFIVAIIAWLHCRLARPERKLSIRFAFSSKVLWGTDSRQ